MKDEFTRDRLIVGIRDSRLSEELQEDHTITLATVIEKIRSREQIKQQQQLMAAENTRIDSHSNIDAIDQRYKSKQQKAVFKGINMITNCAYCGRQHERRACPAFGKACISCGKQNHFAAVCKSKTRSVKEVVTEGEETVDLDEIYLCAIEEKGCDPWKNEIKIGTLTLKMKVDSGADVSYM